MKKTVYLSKDQLNEALALYVGKKGLLADGDWTFEATYVIEGKDIYVKIEAEMST